MSTNITTLKFDDGADIVVRMYTTTGGSSTFDIAANSIDFSHPQGVLVDWNPTEETTSRTLFPYNTIQQIFQAL